MCPLRGRHVNILIGIHSDQGQKKYTLWVERVASPKRLPGCLSVPWEAAGDRSPLSYQGCPIPLLPGASVPLHPGLSGETQSDQQGWDVFNPVLGRAAWRLREEACEDPLWRGGGRSPQDQSHPSTPFPVSRVLRTGWRPFCAPSAGCSLQPPWQMGHHPV